MVLLMILYIIIRSFKEGKKCQNAVTAELIGVHGYVIFFSLEGKASAFLWIKGIVGVSRNPKILVSLPPSLCRAHAIHSTIYIYIYI